MESGQGYAKPWMPSQKPGMGGGRAPINPGGPYMPPYEGEPGPLPPDIGGRQFNPPAPPQPSYEIMSGIAPGGSGGPIGVAPRPPSAGGAIGGGSYMGPAYGGGGPIGSGPMPPAGGMSKNYTKRPPARGVGKGIR